MGYNSEPTPRPETGLAFSSTVDVLLELVREYPSLIATIVLGGVIAVVAAGYLLLVLVAHFPRKEVASERVYRTVTATGEITPERELVDVWVDDGTEKSKEKEEKSRGGKEAKEQPGSISISVVVPAYNEFLRLPGMLAEAVTFLTLSYPLGDWEILIVDDGSTDDTAKAALNWTVNYIRVAGEKGIAEGSVRVCKLARNRGKGGAVTHGMKHVRGKYAVFADADGATRFKDLRVLFERVKEVEKGGHGVAVGSRAHMVTTDAVVKRSLIRNLLMHTFHTYLHIMGISRIRDTQCGFKLFSLPTIQAIFPYMHNEGWIFDVEILLLAEREGIPIVEVPVTWHEVAGTKVSLVRDSVKMAWDLLVLRGGYAVGIYGGEASVRGSK